MGIGNPSPDQTGCILQVESSNICTFLPPFAGPNFRFYERMISPTAAPYLPPPASFYTFFTSPRLFCISVSFSLPLRLLPFYLAQVFLHPKSLLFFFSLHRSVFVGCPRACYPVRKNGFFFFKFVAFPSFLPLLQGDFAFRSFDDCEQSAPVGALIRSSAKPVCSSFPLFKFFPCPHTCAACVERPSRYCVTYYFPFFSLRYGFFRKYSRPSLGYSPHQASIEMNF